MPKPQSNKPKSQSTKPLTEQMVRYCEEYVKNPDDQTACAITAGYSAATAVNAASRLMADPRVKERIAHLRQARSRRTKIDADYVLKRLVEIDQMDVLDILTDEGGLKPVSQWPKVWRTSLSAMDINRIRMAGGDGEEDIESTMQKVKWPDKVKNLELIGKHVGVSAFKEVQELNINISLADKLAAARKRAAGATGAKDE
ncbi:terminase small subunit [Pantoea agglomerans]|uniref:terminase small subunit n=1 Tax=Enterobacter agglomerans TaxID=549 RepID=UPI003C7CC1CF